MMEPDATPPVGPEVEMGTSDSPGISMPTNSPITFWQGVVGLGGTLLTVLGTWGAVILRRKRPKTGAEDAVYEINTRTIEDQRAQIVALKAENDALRASRGEFELSSLRMQAALERADRAAREAQDALRAGAVELVELRAKKLAADRYIFQLRQILAQHNLPYPDPPEGLI